MDETVKTEKVKMVFVGSKNAPTGFKLGEVILRRKRYLDYPWFKPLPKENDAKIGDLVSLSEVPGGKEKVQVKMPESRISNPAILNIKEKFRMRFRNSVEGVRIKNAPGTYIDGEIYTLSLRHADNAWFELIEDAGVIMVPTETSDSNYEEEEIFVPPEAVDEETDFEELKIEPELPGPYTSKELDKMMKSKQDATLDKDDFAEADEEERETGLLKVETLEDLKEDEALVISPEQDEDEPIDPNKVIKIEGIGEETAEDELTAKEPETETLKAEDLSFTILDETTEQVGEVIELKLKKMNKIGLVTFITEHGGVANMRMKRDDLLSAALSIRENLEE